MTTPLYRQAFVHAWQLARRQKFLWIFGLFAAFLGQLGIVEILTKIGLATSDVSNYLVNIGFSAAPAVAREAGVAASTETRLLFFWLLATLLTLGIGLVFAAVVSQGALIHATAQSVRGKRAVNISSAWHASVGHFWRLLALNVIKKGLIIFLAVMVSAAAFTVLGDASIGNNLFFLLTFVVAGAVGLVLSFLVIYAAGYVVVEEYPLLPAIGAAWKLLVGHWLVSIEVGLLIILSNIILALATLLGFAVFFFPAMLVWFVAIVTGSQALLAAGFVFAIIFFTAYLLWLGAMFTVFTTSVWTYLFMKMHKHGIPSRLVHWLSYKPA